MHDRSLLAWTCSGGGVPYSVTPCLRNSFTNLTSSKYFVVIYFEVALSFLTYAANADRQSTAYMFAFFHKSPPTALRRRDLGRKGFNTCSKGNLVYSRYGRSNLGALMCLRELVVTGGLKLFIVTI